MIKITGAGAVQAAVAAALLTVSACGGSTTSPTSTPPSGGGSVGSTGAVGTSGATITIAANGAVSPGQVTVTVGQSVTFVNNDTRTHDMASDPHPSHTGCPAIANVGNLQAGQTKLTFGFSGTGSCGFHDHGNPGDAALKGSITIR